MEDIHQLTASQASRALRLGEISAVGLVEALLARIAELDPSLRAWVAVDGEGARRAAVQADAQRASGVGGEKPLLGVPLGLKDIYDASGLPTTAESPIYAGFVPEQDATCVACLKDAGAIILGKTVTTEFAFVEPPPTRSPWDQAVTPGGSSSGSAVAVATRMCAAAMGSQTAGSTLRPAAYNGIVGFKPSYGRVSRAGIFPLAWTLDTVGILARSVEDAALLLGVMAGHDERDPLASTMPASDYSNQMVLASTRPPRIGILRAFLEDRATAEVIAHTAEVVQHLRDSGAEIVRIDSDETFERCFDDHQTIMATEAAAIHRHSHANRASDYGEKMRGLIERGLLIPGVDYLAAQQRRRGFSRQIDRLLDRCDIIVTPATPSVAPRDLSTTGDPSYQTPWTFAGLPTIALPTGLNSNGLPLALQLIGRRFEEGALLGAARWVEEVVAINLQPPLGR